MRIELSEQSIDALAETISGGSAGTVEASIGVYRQGWRLEAWFRQSGIPYNVRGESRLPATKTAIAGAIFIDNDGSLLREVTNGPPTPATSSTIRIVTKQWWTTSTVTCFMMAFA